MSTQERQPAPDFALLLKISHKAVVEKFLKVSGIVPVVGGMLDDDLKDSNDMALEFISYAITSYPTLPGIVDKVKMLARVMNGSPDEERKYHNTLTEFMALRFVAQVLNEPIIGLESSSSHGKPGKKCDLESDCNGESRFYEVKDLSSETRSQEPVSNYRDLTSFDPALPPKLKKWIENRIGDCMAKGANYLICRAPAWHVRGWPKLTANWVTGLYPKFTQTGPTTFRVDHGVAKQPFFKGVYLLRRDEHLLMEF